MARRRGQQVQAVGTAGAGGSAGHRSRPSSWPARHADALHAAAGRRPLRRRNGRRDANLGLPQRSARRPAALPFAAATLRAQDSCNERLVVLQQDGQVQKLVGRPGARRGQLSSPSGAACQPRDGRVLYAASLIETPGAGYGGRTHAQRCILKLGLPNLEVQLSSPLRPQERCPLYGTRVASASTAPSLPPYSPHSPLTPPVAREFAGDARHARGHGCHQRPRVRRRPGVYYVTFVTYTAYVTYVTYATRRRPGAAHNCRLRR